MKKDDLLQWSNRILTAIFTLAFLYIAVFLATSSFLLFIGLLLFTALPFTLVTLMRHLFAKKRPYQNSSKIPPRKGKNDSFPSRHAFSAFHIAMTAFSANAPLGYTLLALAVLLSSLRVFRGIHYPIDVIAGGFLGVFSGTICLIIL